MKIATLLFIILSFQLLFSQHKNMGDYRFYYYTQIELPGGKLISHNEFEKLNKNRDYKFDIENKKTEIGKYYVVLKNSSKEKKEALKQRNKKSSEQEKGPIVKDQNGNILSWYEFHELINTGNWGLDYGKDSKTKRQTMTFRPAKEYEKKRFKINKRRDSILGTPAEKFTITDMVGNTIDSKNTKGKVIFLNYWFTTCPPCIEEIPGLNKLYEKYKNNNQVVFMSVSRDWKERIIKFEKKHPIDMPVSATAQNTIDIFNITSYPTNMIIDKKGNYHTFFIGGHKDIAEDIDIAITDALKQ